MLDVVDLVEEPLKFIVFIKQNLTIIFESWIIIGSITVYYLQNKLCLLGNCKQT